MTATSNGKRRVVVTGIGAVSPLGLTARETWKNALEGRSGVANIALFDPTDCPVTFAAEVKNFDVTRPVVRFIPFQRARMPSLKLQTLKRQDVWDAMSISL